MKEFFKKYLTQKNRNIISICIIVFGLLFIYNYSFNRPTYINKYIATKIYKEPANSAFTDQNFYNCVINAYNIKNNTNVEYTESLTDEQLATITNLGCSNRQITSADGIEKLTSLEWLNLQYNRDLETLDLSSNINLKTLNADHNKLKVLNVSGLQNLETVYVNSNQLETLDLSIATNLKRLYVNNNILKTLNVSGLQNLEILNVDSNQLETLDLSNDTNLKTIKASHTKLKTLNVSGLQNIEELEATYNQLETLDLSGNTNLKKLKVYDNKLKTLNVSELQNLETVYVNSNQLETLDLSIATNLKTLYVNNNILKTLNVSGLQNLEILNVDSNQLETLDLSNDTNLKTIKASHTKLKTLNVSGLQNLETLEATYNQLETLDLSGNTNLKTLKVYDNKLKTLNVSGLQNLEKLFAYNNEIEALDLSSDINLKILEVYDNKLKTLNVSGLQNIEELLAYNNEIEVLDLSSDINLKTLKVYNNEIEVLDLSSAANLKTLEVNNNQLKILNVSGLQNIEELSANNNELEALDLSSAVNLKRLYVNNNQLKILNVSGLLSLEYLYMSNNNKTTSLYARDNPNLKSIILSYNYLTSIDISGVDLSNLDINLYNVTFDRAVYKGDNFDTSELIIYSGGNLSVTDILVNTGNGIVSNEITVSGSKVKSSVSGKAKLWVYCDNIFNRNWNVEFLDLYIIEATSNKYIIDENNWYIYTGNDIDSETIINNINLNYGTGSIENNKYIIRYNDEIIKEFDIVNINSNKYDLTKDYIYYGASDINNVKNDITCINCILSINNNNLSVLYNNTELVRYPLLGIETDYDVEDNKIYVFNDYGDNDRILSNITSPLCNLSIEDNKLIVKYNTRKIDEYVLLEVNNYLEVTDYKINKEINVIYRIDNNSINNLYSKINANGELSIVDKDNNVISNNSNLKTGYMLRVIYNNDFNNPTYYKLSIIGDVLGTGEVSIAGAKKIARHIINGSVITGDEYLLAADYDGNGVIKLNDVIKMLIEKE